MPDCPVATTVQLIGNKWKLLILRNLLARPWRFNELRKSLDGISQKVLTESLLLLKVRAVHFAGLVPRITDQTDVLDILAFLGIHTIEEVKQNPLTKSFEKKYPRCFEFLEKTREW